jgi:hypothetical protein
MFTIFVSLTVNIFVLPDETENREFDDPESIIENITPLLPDIVSNVDPLPCIVKLPDIKASPVNGNAAPPPPFKANEAVKAYEDELAVEAVDAYEALVELVA